MITEDGLRETASSISSLVIEKRRAYGDSFTKSGEILAILYPDGVPPEAYPDMLAIVRILDKLVRISTSAGEADVMNESPWKDVLGYSLLMTTDKEHHERGQVDNTGDR